MIIDDEVYDHFKTWTRQYINDYCLVRDTKMPGKIPGTTYTWMFYLRNGLFNKTFMTSISIMFIYQAERHISESLDFQLTGLETAATPMVVGIPLVLDKLFPNIDISGFIVRKDPKEYGLLNWIEGLENDKPVLMVDDLCNSSSSLRRCYDILTLHDRFTFLPYAFTIVNKSNKEVHDKYRLESDMYLPPNFKVISLFTLDDFGLTGPSH